MSPSYLIIQASQISVWGSTDSPESAHSPAGADTFVRHQCGHQSPHLLPVECQVYHLEVQEQVYSLVFFSLKCLKKDELPNLDIHLGRRFWFCFTYSFYLVPFFFGLQTVYIFKRSEVFFLVNLSQKQHESSISAGQCLQKKINNAPSLYDHGWSSRVSASIPEWHTYQHTLTQTHRQVCF